MAPVIFVGFEAVRPVADAARRAASALPAADGKMFTLLLEQLIHLSVQSLLNSSQRITTFSNTDYFGGGEEILKWEKICDLKERGQGLSIIKVFFVSRDE